MPSGGEEGDVSPISPGGSRTKRKLDGKKGEEEEQQEREEKQQEGEEKQQERVERDKKRGKREQSFQGGYKGDEEEEEDEEDEDGDGEEDMNAGKSRKQRGGARTSAPSLKQGDTVVVKIENGQIVSYISLAGFIKNITGITEEDGGSAAKGVTSLGLPIPRKVEAITEQQTPFTTIPSGFKQIQEIDSTGAILYKLVPVETGIKYGSNVFNYNEPAPGEELYNTESRKRARVGGKKSRKNKYKRSSKITKKQRKQKYKKFTYHKKRNTQKNRKKTIKRSKYYK
jgi:hypothetical protein